MLRLLVLILFLRVRNSIIVKEQNLDIKKTCSEIITNFTNYKCLEKNNKNPDENIFIIEKEKVKFLLKVETKVEEREFLESLNEIEEKAEKIDSKIIADQIYEIYTYPKNGNILSYVKTLKSQNEKLRLFLEIITLISKFHSKNIILNKITPKNIYIDKNKKPIFIDFSKSVENAKKAIPTGIPQFVAPEMLKYYKSESQEFTPKQDIWSLGILLYLIIYNKMPFLAENNEQFIRELFFSSGILIEKNTSVNIVRILNGMLKLNPQNRETLYEIESECIEGIVNLNKSVTERDSYLDLKNFKGYKIGYLDMFSEMIFVLFIVIFVIPISVYLISKNIDKEDQDVGDRVF